MKRTLWLLPLVILVAALPVFRATKPATTIANGECEWMGPPLGGDNNAMAARCIFTDHDCGATGNGCCGDELTEFYASLDVARDALAHGFGSAVRIHAVIPSGYYPLCPPHGMFVDIPDIETHLAGALFGVHTSKTASIASTPSAVLGVDPKDPFRVNCTGAACDFCGKGACNETGDPLHTGDLLIVDEDDDNSWDYTDNRVSVTRVVDDDTLDVSHRMTGTTSDQFIVSTWHPILLGPNAVRVSFTGHANLDCQDFGVGKSMCPWTTSDNPSGPDTLNRHRNLPIAAVVTRGARTDLSAFHLRNWNHPDDLGCGAFTDGPDAAGNQNGMHKLCSTVTSFRDGEEMALFWRGDDPNSAADDAQGSCYEAATYTVSVGSQEGQIGGPTNCMTGFRHSTRHGGISLGSGDRSGGEQNWVYFDSTRGGAPIDISLTGEAHIGSGCRPLGCPPLATRPALVRFGDAVWDAHLNGAIHHVHGTTWNLAGDERPAFLIEDDDATIHLHDVHLENISDLFVAKASGSVISGRVFCYNPTQAGGCELDAGLVARDLVICTTTGCTQHGLR